MVLNNYERAVLRNRVNIKLKDIDFDPDKRIILPPKRLDNILFDYDFDGNKFFNFYYDNLCKLDLSNIDFENTIFTDFSKIDLTNSNININKLNVKSGMFIVKSNNLIPIFGNLRDVTKKINLENEQYDKELSYIINDTLDLIDAQRNQVGGRFVHKKLVLNNISESKED